MNRLFSNLAHRWLDFLEIDDLSGASLAGKPHLLGAALRPVSATGPIT
jgi:hypothetical protein